MSGSVVGLLTFIMAILLLCSILVYRYTQNNQNRIFRHLKKLRRHCCICSKKVPKNTKYTVLLNDHKFNQAGVQHVYHPLCVKKVLEFPEEYAEKDPMIVKTAIACYDNMKSKEETKRHWIEKTKREREEAIREAKTRNLDLFLEQSKGADFK